MGQKANPTSLRLKKTNQSFNSCWYSDIYYSKLLSQELRVKQYLSNIFNQIKYPYPHLSFSLFPKKIRAMAMYLNPIESRHRRCERFQLKLVQGTSSIARNGSGRTDSQHSPDLLLTDVGSPSGSPSKPTSMYPSSNCSSLPIEDGYKMSTGSDLTNHLLLPITIDVCPLGNAAREKRFFVHRLLLSIAIRKGTGERLFWRKDFELFQKLHRLTWFQRREESSSFLLNKRQLITSDRRSEYRHTKIELAGYNFDPSKMGLKRSSKMGGDSPATLRDCFPHTLRSTTYNTSQTLQNLRSAKVIIDNSTSRERREFSTFCNSRVFAPSSSLLIRCSSLPITTHHYPSLSMLIKDQHWYKMGTKWVQDGYKISTRTASNGLSAWQGVQKGHPRHQQNLSPKLPTPRKDHVYVNLLESTIEKGVGCSMSLCFYKSTDDGQAASFLSEEIAYYLERRVPFRRIKQLLLRELRSDYIEGVRVNCFGRVGGRSKKAQRARGERFQWGQTSSHVFSSKLSFASRNALTSFGKVGIKVWICYK